MSPSMRTAGRGPFPAAPWRHDMTDTTLQRPPSAARAETNESRAIQDSGRFTVRQAAVLGAGVMGAQIAAHLANANVRPILFELAAEGKDKNANGKKALGGRGQVE